MGTTKLRGLEQLESKELLAGIVDSATWAVDSPVSESLSVAEPAAALAYDGNHLDDLLAENHLDDAIPQGSALRSTSQKDRAPLAADPVDHDQPAGIIDVDILAPDGEATETTSIIDVDILAPDEVTTDASGIIDIDIFAPGGLDTDTSSIIDIDIFAPGGQTIESTGLRIKTP